MVGVLLAHSLPDLAAAAEDGAETRLRAEIEALAERLALPGIAYGVVQDGELLFDSATDLGGAAGLVRP